MIELKNICKTYVAGDTKVNALSDISVSFREHEFVAILGQSGCGKTTLLNILGGLDRYDSGDIKINGKSTKHYKDRDWDTYRNHYIGFVFQNYNLIPHLTVIENVELSLSIGGIDNKKKRQLAIDALKEVGLESQLKKRPNQLSGGQMQRVAIARAIVNNPEIILADEPTGALDSETSVQVMDILKKISKKHLVIMVTHNGDLAEKYSTRIIKLHDGKMIGDSKPLNKKSKTREDEKGKRRTAMSLFTAFSLSFKNLFAKRLKTILVSFAGSIGIIGIALVLSVSNGFTDYINKLQSDALGSYPISVSAISMDMTKFASMDTSNNNKNEDDAGEYIVPYNPLTKYVQYGHYNNLTSEFVEKVKQFEQDDMANGKEKLNTVDYNYYVPVKLITKTKDGEYVFIKRKNSTSILSADVSTPIFPMLDNLDYVLEQYEIVNGRMPQKNDDDPFTKEVLLVVGGGNKMSYATLESLGFKTTLTVDGSYEKLDLEDVFNKEYKLLLNDDYYTPNSTNIDEITQFSKIDTSKQEELELAYNSAEYTIKICGVLRQKEDATASLLQSGLVYMRDLEDYYKTNCENSIIGLKERQNKQNGDYTLYDPYDIEVAELPILPAYPSVAAINGFLYSQYGYTLSNEDAFEIAMQQIGISTIPINIKFYPKNFSAKESIVSMINSYNETKELESEKIVYSDTSEFLTNTLGQLVNIISYVLIAFAGISLIVSSIMIGIITYTSVIERTKEIGVLRSIGARKKDISRVFNMETFIIGLTAGIIGVVVTFILTFPISNIIRNLSDGAAITNIASLRLDHAVALVFISVVLTLLAGLIPAKIASKKDPVKALRTE
ncbi:MAG: ATP-binding cassette domain-containing protein [Clostridia bacterium]|nr:ATP-binding cassette domain-containing protein [Clostridia bacterium]